jgi:hypothetical protein
MFMPGNPMLEGLLAAVAAQNPEVVANAASSAGIPPPSTMAGGMGNSMDSLGAFFPPQGMREGVAAAGADAGLGSWAPTVTPAQGVGPGNLMAPNSMLQGFKAPQAPSPVFNAGVSGAQKAPEGPSVQMGGQGAQGLNQLIMALMQRQGAGVGSLGQYIGG